ncbi:MAG: transglycosylase SLT domain-containing protein [Deltaproteobacteria bacterium]|nr:transglycosylase SLT domain-containing protein [Deltaproteobacteria bacterium]
MAQPAALQFAGENVPLDQVEVFEGIDQELLLLSEARARVFLTLRRSPRYLPIIEAALQSEKVPRDFIFLPLAITNLTPDYRSSGRQGMWRLTDAQGRGLGLTINNQIDERLDPTSSSQKVAIGLKSLHSSYGSWTLALAALLDYDAINAALSGSAGEMNYYKLYVPENLDKLVSQVLAGKILYSDPEAYGYRTSHFWRPIVKSRVTLSSSDNMRSLAARYNVDYKTFRDMNPHILTEVAPLGATLNIP